MMGFWIVTLLSGMQRVKGRNEEISKAMMLFLYPNKLYLLLLD